MEVNSRSFDTLTVYFDTEDSAQFKIDTVIKTLEAVRELYGCFSVLCFGQEPDKNQNTVRIEKGSLLLELFFAIVAGGIIIPVIKPTFEGIGNRLRDLLCKEKPKDCSEKNGTDIPEMIQKLLENPCERNTEVLRELLECVKISEQNCQKAINVLSRIIEANNACCKQWYHDLCIKIVRINNGTEIQREDFREHLLSRKENTTVLYDTELEIIRPALIERNEKNRKVSWFLRESVQPTAHAYSMEDDDFQRKVSDGDYGEFMKGGTAIVARIKRVKTGTKTERFVTDVFEIKSGEKEVSLRPKPSDFPLLEQETEEAGLKTDLDSRQLKLF